MARGGARSHSGPPPDPSSERSELRGFKLTALPAAGFDGETPKFPLPARVLWDEWWEGSGRNRTLHRERDESGTRRVRRRELELWRWAWTTPQACAWSLPSEGWRLHSIAMWVRTYVICEGETATAADKGSLHRFADDIGLSPAGLKVNGWAVAVDQLHERRADQPPAEPTADGTPGAAPAEKPKRQRRLRAAPDAQR